MTMALREELLALQQQAAEDIEKNAEQGKQQIEGAVAEMKDTVMSMRIRTTASEERAMRVQKQTQQSVKEVANNLDALSTNAATGMELAELRKKLEATQLEMVNVKLPNRSRKLMSQPPPPPLVSGGGGSIQERESDASAALSAALQSQDGITDDAFAQEVSAQLLKLSRRVDTWEDKLLESQQLHRASATRLQERVQRCHGKFDEAKAVVVKIEEDAQMIHQQLEADNGRMKQHEERMAAQDERAEQAEQRLTKDEERITLLESIDTDKAEQIANLAKRSGELEEGVGLLNEAIASADVERGLVAESVEKCRERLDSVGKELLEVDQKIEKNGQDDIGHQIMLQGLCDKNATKSDGLEKDLARLTQSLQDVADKTSSKSDDLETELSKLGQSLQDVTAETAALDQLGPKFTQLSIRVDNLDRQMQEDIGAHQRRFDDGTALAREKVASKRRESREKLEARVRRKSERLNSSKQQQQPPAAASSAGQAVEAT